MKSILKTLIRKSPTTITRICKFIQKRLKILLTLVIKLFGNVGRIIHTNSGGV